MALTIADIEMLIGTGLIPAQNADAARNLINSQNTKTSGSTVSNSQGSEQSCLIINQNLIKGRSGSLVSALQKFLKNQGHFPSTESTSGIYGDITVKAVTDFQVATGLIKTSTEVGAGTVGPITRQKIQEISCKKLGESQQTQTAIINSTSTATTTTKTNFISGLNNVATKQNTIQTTRPPKVTLGYYERFKDEETGKAVVRYDVVATPKDLASYLEGVILCDPIALKATSADIKKCGDTFIVDPMKNGKKSFSVSFENSSRFPQPVTFAVEVFNTLRESIGMEKIDNEVPANRPAIKLQIGNNNTNQRSAVPLTSRNCSFAEQLDFLRYTMTPFNPVNTVSIPTCWPGEILCNQSNPPTYCRIPDGPTSDDLCPKSQRFFEGRCVARQ